MGTAAIDLNDTGIAIACDGVLLASSPGYALLGREPLLIGEAARRASRLEPLNSVNRFWHELDERPLATLAAAGRSHADLAYLHLLQIRDLLGDRADAVVCAVPATLGGREVALILSMARECGLPLIGFIDAAVAAAAPWPGSGRFLYVDLHLHRAVVTAVDAGTQFRRERFESAPHAGLAALYDGWMRLVSRNFVRQTRFDPLHQAATEQELFDLLPQWLDRLVDEPSIEAQMRFGAEDFQVPLTREAVALEAERAYGEILLCVHRLRRSGVATTLALSHEVSRLPGLRERLAEFSDCELVKCPPGAAAFGALAHAGMWSAAPDSATLFAAAGRLEAAVAEPLMPILLRSAAPAEPADAPSHVLYRGQAIALEPTPLVVGLAPGGARRSLQVGGASAGISRLHCSLMRTAQGAFVVDHSRHGTWLNDVHVPGRAALRAGDRLRLGSPGVVLELIAIG
jgi:hypothetical protein